MKTGLILNINNDLCELYIIEENRRAFAFIPNELQNQISLGKRFVVYPYHQMMRFSKEELSLC